MPRTSTSGTAATLLQLKITLRDVKPPIWRRVRVADDLSFEQLHRVIQAAMGWEDCHLHEFQVGKERIGPTTADPFDFGDDMAARPERGIRLREALGGHKKFSYWYDFGDDWGHDITIEKSLPAATAEARVADASPADAPATPDLRAGRPSQLRPQLVAGQRACPPEDCGGPWGYAELLAVLGDPEHPERQSMLEWAGDLDPESFDLDSAAKAVAATVRTRKAKG